MKKLLSIFFLLIGTATFAQIKVLKVIGQQGIAKADSINGYVTPTQLAQKLDTSHHDITNVFAPIYSMNVNDSTHELHVHLITDTTLSGASDTSLASSLAVKKYANRVDYVANISDLENYTGNAKTVVVQDTLRGGVFNYITVGIPDSGTVFNRYSGGYWIRQFEKQNGVNVDWWGYDAIEDSAAIFSAIRYAKVRGLGLNFNNRIYKFRPKSTGHLYGGNQMDITVGADITGIPFFAGTGTLDCSALGTDSLYTLFEVKGTIKPIDTVTIASNVTTFNIKSGLGLKNGDIIFAVSPQARVVNISKYNNGQRLVVDSYNNSTGSLVISSKINDSSYYYLYLNDYMPQFEVKGGLTFIAPANSFLCAFRTKFAVAKFSGTYKNFGDATIQLNGSLGYVNDAVISGIIGGNNGWSYGVGSNDLSKVYVNNCDISGGKALAAGGGGRVFFGFNIGNLSDSNSCIFPTDMYVTGGSYKTSPLLSGPKSECLSPHANTNDFFISDATIYGSLNTGAANTIVNNCNFYFTYATAVTMNAAITNDNYGNLTVTNSNFHSYYTPGNSYAAFGLFNNANSMTLRNVNIDGYYDANQPISLQKKLNYLTIDGLSASVDSGVGRSSWVYVYSDNYKFNNIKFNKTFLQLSTQVDSLNIRVSNYTAINSADAGIIVVPNGYVSRSVFFYDCTILSATGNGFNISNSRNVTLNNNIIRNVGPVGLSITNINNTTLSNNTISNATFYGILTSSVPTGATYSMSNNLISGSPTLQSWTTTTPIYVQDGGIVRSGQYILTDLNNAPASATATGTKGEFRTDGNYIYFCKDTNTWVRSPLTTW